MSIQYQSTCQLIFGQPVNLDFIKAVEEATATDDRNCIEPQWYLGVWFLFVSNREIDIEHIMNA